MDFRAEKEGVEHCLSVKFYKEQLQNKVVEFFGIVIDKGQICGDKQQPEMFEEFFGRPSVFVDTFKLECYMSWKNLMDGKYFVKGVHDSNTKEKVLATKTNIFCPHDCYFAFVKDLPKGTAYVETDRFSK